ncbi:hypothetical protein ABTZ99_03125 [Actinosynnema sp. NPDC002837]
MTVGSTDTSHTIDPAAPIRTRHRKPSINCLLLHFGGRPDLAPTGGKEWQDRSPRVGQVGLPRCRYADYEVSGTAVSLGR